MSSLTAFGLANVMMAAFCATSIASSSEWPSVKHAITTPENVSLGQRFPLRSVPSTIDTYNSLMFQPRKMSNDDVYVDTIDP